MIAEVVAQVPGSLAAYRNGVAAGSDRPAAIPLSSLRDPTVFDATLSAFGAGFGAADRRALVSYWSQFYLAALATPALTALVRLGRPLPLAFDTTSLELDAAGRPSCLVVALDRWDGGEARASRLAPGLAGLVNGHLCPFVEMCHARCGISPRVLWGNAAVILDYVARELGGAGTPACDEVANGLGWRAGSGCARTPLAQALCPGAPDGRHRRACCLRHRLPGVPSCGRLCPLERARDP